MKNILRYTLAICTAGLLPVACTSNFDEYNTNQNQMEMGDVHPLNLLEHILFTGADGMVYRTWLLNNELIQYTVQMYTENVHRYMIRDSYNSGTWNHLARWAANSDHMIEQAVKNGDANSEAIALTMRALFVSNWTDIYGDIPFSEAFQGRNNVLKPKFDTQKEVYTQLFADLERANSLYDPSRALRYPNKDLMYKGDIAKWRKFTNSLHMRLLMRLQNRDEEMGVSEKLREIVSNPSRYPVMASNADNAALFYTNVDPFIGRFGTMTLQNFTSNSHRMAEHLVNMMNNTNDPRLGIYAVQQNNEWTGLVSGYPTTETNATNCAYLNKDVLGDYTSPYTFMRYDEVPVHSLRGGVPRHGSGRQRRGAAVLRAGRAGVDRLLGRNQPLAHLRDHAGAEERLHADRGLRQHAGTDPQPEVHRPLLGGLRSLARVPPHGLSQPQNRQGHG